MIKSNKRVKIGKQPDYLKMVIEMKKYELEMIKETIDRVDVMKEDDFREYFFRMFPNRSERYYYYMSLIQISYPTRLRRIANSVE